MDINHAINLLSDFFSSGKEIKAKRKDTILRTGDSGDKTFWIKKGCVKVVSYSSQGTTQLHHIFKSNELFPLVNLFNENDATHDYISLSDTTVYVKSKAEVIQFLNASPRALVAITAQGIGAIDHVINLGLESAEKRVAHQLLTLAKRFSTKQGGYSLIDVPLTQQEFAESSRISRETASRILGQLEKKGFILQGRSQTLIYPDKLSQILD